MVHVTLNDPETKVILVPSISHIRLPIGLHAPWFAHSSFSTARCA